MVTPAVPLVARNTEIETSHGHGRSRPDRQAGVDRPRRIEASSMAQPGQHRRSPVRGSAGVAPDFAVSNDAQTTELTKYSVLGVEHGAVAQACTT
jgi:hypothetical protein